MRRILLVVALVALVLVDLSILPMAVLMIFLSGVFGVFGAGDWLALMLFSLVVAAVPVSLTIAVAKALGVFGGAAASRR